VIIVILFYDFLPDSDEAGAWSIFSPMVTERYPGSSFQKMLGVVISFRRSLPYQLFIDWPASPVFVSLFRTSSLFTVYLDPINRHRYFFHIILALNCSIFGMQANWRSSVQNLNLDCETGCLTVTVCQYSVGRIANKCKQQLYLLIYCLSGVKYCHM
jgi:hypothetical protein